MQINTKLYCLLFFVMKNIFITASESARAELSGIASTFLSRIDQEQKNTPTDNKTQILYLNNLKERLLNAWRAEDCQAIQTLLPHDLKAAAAAAKADFSTPVLDTRTSK